MAPRSYSLYDPVTGFAYTYDLFEKDLYRQSVTQSNASGNQPTAGSHRLSASSDRLTLP